MNKKIIVVVLIFVFILLLSGCVERNVTGVWYKDGRVKKIDYDVVFGGTFTDYRDDIYFYDGTVLSSQGRDLSSIQLNRTGRFYFDKNYFEYDGCDYKFDNFKYVVWLDGKY